MRRRRSKLWSELETLRELDAKISNSTQRSNRKFNKATTEKKTGQRLGLFLGRDDLTLIFFGFFVDCRYEEQNRSRLRKLVNLTEQHGNLIPLDRGEGVPIFRWELEIDYGGDDFHDPTTNVRRRCALAIAKPTPRGYWSRGCTINLTTKVNSCKQSKNKQELRIAIWILRI